MKKDKTTLQREQIFMRKITILMIFFLFSLHFLETVFNSSGPTSSGPTSMERSGTEFLEKTEKFEKKVEKKGKDWYKHIVMTISEQNIYAVAVFSLLGITCYVSAQDILPPKSAWMPFLLYFLAMFCNFKNAIINEIIKNVCKKSSALLLVIKTFYDFWFYGLYFMIYLEPRMRSHFFGLKFDSGVDKFIFDVILTCTLGLMTTSLLVCSVNFAKRIAQDERFMDKVQMFRTYTKIPFLREISYFQVLLLAYKFGMDQTVWKTVVFTFSCIFKLFTTEHTVNQLRNDNKKKYDNAESDVENTVLQRMRARFMNEYVKTGKLKRFICSCAIPILIEFLILNASIKQWRVWEIILDVPGENDFSTLTYCFEIVHFVVFLGRILITWICSVELADVYTSLYSNSSIVITDSLLQKI